MVAWRLSQVMRISCKTMNATMNEYFGRMNRRLGVFETTRPFYCSVFQNIRLRGTYLILSIQSQRDA
jgi:hypothetical protein